MVLHMFNKTRLQTLVAPQGRLLDRDRKVDHVGKHGVPEGGGGLRLHEGFTDRSEKHEHHDDHEKHGYHAARLGMLALDGLAHDGLSAGVILNRQQWLLVVLSRFPPLESNWVVCSTTGDV
jgi:hypothetical protein